MNTKKVNACENILSRIYALDASMTLKDNYDEELHVLSGIQSDMSVFRYMGELSRGQLKLIYENLNVTRNFIEQELASKKA